MSWNYKKNILLYLNKINKTIINSFIFLAKSNKIYKKMLTNVSIYDNIKLANRKGPIAQLGEHLPYKQGVTGSSPVGTTIKWGRSSVWLERLPVTQEVASSILVAPAILKHYPVWLDFFIFLILLQCSLTYMPN